MPLGFFYALGKIWPFSGTRKPTKSLYITTSGHCPRKNSPTNSSEEAIFEDLAEWFPENRDYRTDLRKSHIWLSRWFAADLRLEEAVEERRFSLGIIRDLATEFPTSDEYREVLVSGNSELGRRLTGVGKFDEAEAYNLRCRFGGWTADRIRRVEVRQYSAYLLFRLARYKEAQQVLLESLDIAEQELAPNASPPNVGWTRHTYLLAECHQMIGLLGFYSARFENAEKHLQKAIDAAEPLHNDYPKSVWIPYLLGRLHHDLAVVLTAMGHLEEAEEARRKALSAWESAGNPVAASLPHGKGFTHYRLAELLDQTGRTEEAEGEFAESASHHGGPLAASAR